MKYQKPVVKKPKHEIVRGILESDSGYGSTSAGAVIK